LGADKKVLGARLAAYSPALRWVVAGPFKTPPKQGYRMLFPPQWTWGPDASFRAGDDLIQWQALDADHTVQHDGIDFHKPFGHQEHAVAYALTKLRSDHEQDVELRFGSDDTLTVWLNGQKLHSVEAYRLAEPDQEIVRARLQAGANIVVAKVAQDLNPWRLLMRITGLGGTPLLGVFDGFTDHDAYDPERAVSDEIIEIPQAPRWLLAGPFPFGAGEWKGVHDDMATEAQWPPKRDGVVWRQLPSLTTFGTAIDLNAALGEKKYVDAYVATTVTVSRPTAVQIRSGSDDGMTMWVNGQQVLDVRAWRGYEPESDTAKVTLQSGPNRILCRIRQGGGDWKFGIDLWDVSSSPHRPLEL
jgi:hypothetical protein